MNTQRMCGVIAAIAVPVLLTIGCDEPGPTATTDSTPADVTPSTGPSASPLRSSIEAAAGQSTNNEALTPITAAVATPQGEPRERVELIAIPFTAEVPRSWSVQTGPAGKIVLQGNMPSGEAEILLSTRPSMRPEALDLLLKEIQAETTQPASGGTRTRVTERDGMRIIEETERMGAPGADPDLTPYRWTVQYVVPTGGLEFAVYEMNVIGISESMYRNDESFLRTIFDSVQPQPDAGRAASTRPTP